MLPIITEGDEAQGDYRYIPQVSKTRLSAITGLDCRLYLSVSLHEIRIFNLSSKNQSTVCIP